MTDFRAVLLVVGILITGLGGSLFIGNRTGLAPTVPYLGFTVMAAGAAIMAIIRL